MNRRPWATIALLFTIAACSDGDTTPDTGALDTGAPTDSAMDVAPDTTVDSGPPPVANFDCVSTWEPPTPSAATVSRFCSMLTSRGIQVQVRQRKGDEIHAACGQLRRSVDTQPIYGTSSV